VTSREALNCSSILCVAMVANGVGNEDERKQSEKPRKESVVPALVVDCPVDRVAEGGVYGDNSDEDDGEPREGRPPPPSPSPLAVKQTW